MAPLSASTGAGPRACRRAAPRACRGALALLLAAALPLILPAPVAAQSPTPQQISDASEARTTLNADGQANGVQFTATTEKTLIAASTNGNIGAIDGVSVTTNGGTTARGRVEFDDMTTPRGTATVAGRIGGELSQLRATGVTDRVFKADSALRDQLNEIVIGNRRAVISGSIQSVGENVIFQGSVGAGTLNLDVQSGDAVGRDATAQLRGPSSGTNDVFHRVNITTSTPGRGVLRFGNTRPANLRGDIGTATARLANLSIDTHSGTRTVRILGNIYTNALNLNDNDLKLGNDRRIIATITDGVAEITRVYAPIFGARTSAVYTVSAPITTATDNSGNLRIQDFDYVFESAIGTIGTGASQLSSVNIDNARATFKGDIAARFVSVFNGATLAVDKSPLIVSKPSSLALGSNSTLALGANTLSFSTDTTGQFRINRSSNASNKTTLAFTLDGGSGASGRLDVSSGNGVVVVRAIDGAGESATQSPIVIEVTLTNPDAIVTSKSFTIIQQRNDARVAVPSDFWGMTVAPAGSNRDFSYALSRTGTNNQDLTLTVTRTARPRQVIRDADTSPVDLTADGQGSGVDFRASSEKTLNTTSTFKDIGALTSGAFNGVSVTTNGGATARGSLNFAATGTVSGRVGGVLTNAAGTAFKASPTDLLNKLSINTAGTTAAPTTVTFSRGVGASELEFAAANTAARLNGGGANGFYAMDVTTTMNGQGALRFGNAANTTDVLTLLGDIGANGSNLSRVAVDAPSAGARRIVAMLGNIYANGMTISSNTVALAAGSRLGTACRATPYVIDAPISGDSGVLQFGNCAFNVQRALGASGRFSLLSLFESPNTTFSGDISATTLSVTRSTMTVNKPTLALGGALSLRAPSGNTQPSTLALGPNTLAVSGAVGFTGATSGNAHTLSVTVSKSGNTITSGLLSTTGTSGPIALGDHLNIQLSLAPGSARIEAGETITVARSSTTAFPAALPAGITARLANPIDDPALRFDVSAGGTGNRDLILTARRLNPQIVTAPAAGESADAAVPLDNSGATLGVRFEAQRTLSVANNESIGQRRAADGALVSVTTTADNQGTLAFAGSGTVSARIGSALTGSTAPAGSGRAKASATRHKAFVRSDRRIRQVRINSTDAVTFNGGIGAHSLHFAGNGAARLNGPATGDAELFHQFNVSTASGGQGTLRFGNRTPANLLGDIGAADARLALVRVETPDADTLGGSRTVRILGDIYARSIAIEGRSVLALGNMTNDVFGAGRPRPYVIDAPITGTNLAVLSIKDYNFNLKQSIGTSAAPLNSVSVTNSRDTRLGGDIYANSVSFQNSKVTVNSSLSISSSGGLYMLPPQPERGVSRLSTLALGSNTLTVAGPVSFNGATPHTLSLTLDGATGAASGRLNARALTLASSSNLALQLRIENPDRIRAGQEFTVVSSSDANLPAALASVTVSDTSGHWGFDLSLSANQRALVLRAKRAQPGASGNVARSANDRGDLALVPYYTVRNEWVTGLHIVNTSARTQVVKLRFRRATDGLGALDFNVVLSPRDVYAGFLSATANSDIVWSSPDSTCTVPASSGNRLVMPAIYRAGADSGYVEVIAMGTPSDEQQPIAVAAASASSATAGAAVGSTGTSAAGSPRDCAALRSNFFADGAGTVTGATTRTTKQGVQDHATTWQRENAASPNAVLKAGGRSTYERSGNALKVSYFIRDNATGIEFGDNAVSIRDFLGAPAITNQQYSVLSGDLNGFDFPDLNGGVPLSSAPPPGGSARVIQRGLFNALRASNVLGVNAIVNEWSANPANGVEMNWVVTLPGQYTMLRLPQYAAALASTSSATAGAGHPAPRVTSAGQLTPATVCPRQTILATGTASAIAECDYRDLPVELVFTAYNREQRADTVIPTAELVVSPTTPTTMPKTYLPQVANVITFGGKRVFGPMDHNIDVDLGQPYGWVSARVRSRDADVRVCDWDRQQDNAAGFPGAAAGRALTLECTAVANKGVPVIGFAAWSRRVAANPDASYGRIVEHSYRTEAPPSTPPQP